MNCQKGNALISYYFASRPTTHLISKKSFELDGSDLREERQSWWVRFKRGEAELVGQRIREASWVGVDRRSGSAAWI